MEYRFDKKTLTVFLSGRLDTLTADEISREVKELLCSKEPALLIFDAEKLTHISADGLRMLLQFSGRESLKLRVIDASEEVYDRLDSVGITKMIDIRKKPGEITVDEKQHIGTGTTAEVYRLDDDRIVKLYNPGQDPDWIEAQRNNSQQLFLHGIPGAVPYEAVLSGGRVGVVYEMLEAESLGEAVSRDTGHLEDYARKLAALLRQIHSTKFDKSLLDDTLDYLADHFNVSAIDRYTEKDYAGFAAALNKGDTLVHGDFHPMNIMVKNGELTLIDTGDAFYRYGILDHVTLYTYLILQTDTEEKSLKLNGMKPDTAHRLWDAFIESYFSPQSDEEKYRINMTVKQIALIRTAMAIASTEGIEEAVKPVLIGQILAAVPSDLDAFRKEIDAFEAKYEA